MAWSSRPFGVLLRRALSGRVGTTSERPVPKLDFTLINAKRIVDRALGGRGWGSSLEAGGLQLLLGS